jgi:hypothetical protein
LLMDHRLRHHTLLRFPVWVRFLHGHLPPLGAGFRHLVHFVEKA